MSGSSHVRVPDCAACRCRGADRVVRRPVIVAPPPVVVDEYPVYVAPRVYAAPPVYAYAGPVWRDGWGHRRHFRGRW